MIVYKITNLINNKCYIGRTTRDINTRWLEHVKEVNNNNSRHLYCAMRKYGIDNFRIEEIDTATSIEELENKEYYYTQLYESYDVNKGYNMTDGGDRNPMDHEHTRLVHDEKMRSIEIRSKISNSMKEHYKHNPVTLETRAKLSNLRKSLRFIHKDDICIQVPIEDVPKYLEQGWQKGGKSCDPEVVARRAKNRSRKVRCIDESDNVVNTFDSVKSAADWWYVYSNSNLKSAKSLMDEIKKSAVKNCYINGLKWIYE